MLSLQVTVLNLNLNTNSRFFQPVIKHNNTSKFLYLFVSLQKIYGNIKFLKSPARKRLSSHLLVVKTLLWYARAVKCDITNEATWLLRDTWFLISLFTMFAAACSVVKLGSQFSTKLKMPMRTSGHSVASAKMDIRSRVVWNEMFCKKSCKLFMRLKAMKMLVSQN